jgi:hypothetical protein
MKNTLIGLGLLAVVAVVGVVYPRPLPTQVVKETIKELGAFSGTEFLTDFLSFNGIKHLYPQGRVAMKSGTTTPCVFFPKASSTLVFATADFVISSTTQTTVATFGKGAGDFSTSSTPLGSLTLTDSLKGRLTIMASTSAGTTGDPSVSTKFIFGPTDRLVLGFAGGQHPTTGRPTGTCQAEFIGF